MAFTQEDKEKMDIAAADAEAALENVDVDCLKTVANWWNKYYLTAGHKRLGRVLVQYADKAKEEPSE